MTQIMRGIKVVEVAQFVFVPATGVVTSGGGGALVHAADA